MALPALFSLGERQMIPVASRYPLSLLVRWYSREFESKKLEPRKGVYNATSSEKDDKPIWASYRRNFKGQLQPKKTRKRCIRCNGKVIAGNPCPLCKLQLEKEIEVSYKDPELLAQFVCPHTLRIMPPIITGVCRWQQKRLDKAIFKARDFGYLPFPIPHHTEEEPPPVRPMPKPVYARYRV